MCYFLVFHPVHPRSNVRERVWRIYIPFPPLLSQANLPGSISILLQLEEREISRGDMSHKPPLSATPLFWGTTSHHMVEYPLKGVSLSSVSTGKKRTKREVKQKIKKKTANNFFIFSSFCSAVIIPYHTFLSTPKANTKTAP